MFVINNEMWHIAICQPHDPMLRRSDGSYAIGACDDASKTIYLNKDLRGSYLKKVLCHELTHAAMFSYNVELSIQQEEVVADLIATYGEQIIDITDEIFEIIK